MARDEGGCRETLHLGKTQYTCQRTRAGHMADRLQHIHVIDDDADSPAVVTILWATEVTT